ncbi:hypothetical protein ACFY0A_39685 [Streptomyces sp. NPDC001698]|uniref:hypothetical protein n=1 Tax=Streptomyces sp. NPDC001698 TaxID=3364601 RepID=UPI0036A99B86
MSQSDQEGTPELLSEHLDTRLALLLNEVEPDMRSRIVGHLFNCEKCMKQSPAAMHDVLKATNLFDVGLAYVREPDVMLGREQQRREPRAERWASLAARIAGDRRDMRTAWLADLHGDPEDGVSLTPWQQRRYAVGVLVAAVRYRLRDGLGRLWRPVDWMLATRNRQETSIGVPPALLVIYIAQHDGVHALLTDGWGWVGGCGAATFALIRWLERVRGIELTDRSPSTGE